MSGRVIALTIKGDQGETKQKIEELKPTPQPVPEVRMAKKTYSREELKQVLAEVAEKYGQEYNEMEVTVENESGFNPHAIGDDGDSLGIAQITTKTWFGYCATSNKDERNNPYKALDCMGKLWKMGYPHWWTEYCKAFGVSNPQCNYVFEYLKKLKLQ